MWQLFRAVIFIAIMFVLGNFALGFCAHTAWSQGIGLKEMAEFAKEQNGKKSPELVLNQEEIDQLRMFKKDIAKLQYSEFCATVKLPPKAYVEAVMTAAQAGNTDAQSIANWMGPILDRYSKNGCGDA